MPGTHARPSHHVGGPGDARRPLEARANGLKTRCTRGAVGRGAAQCWNGSVEFAEALHRHGAPAKKRPTGRSARWTGSGPHDNERLERVKRGRGSPPNPEPTPSRAAPGPPPPDTQPRRLRRRPLSARAGALVRVGRPCRGGGVTGYAVGLPGGRRGRGILTGCRGAGKSPARCPWPPGDTSKGGGGVPVAPPARAVYVCGHASRSGFPRQPHRLGGLPSHPQGTPHDVSHAGRTGDASKGGGVWVVPFKGLPALGIPGSPGLPRCAVGCRGLPWMHTVHL